MNYIDYKMKEIKREINKIFELYTIKAKNNKSELGFDLMQIHFNLNSIYTLYDVNDLTFENREDLRNFISVCYEEYLKSIKKIKSN